MKTFFYNDCEFSLEPAGKAWDIGRQLSGGGAALVGAGLFAGLAAKDAESKALALVIADNTPPSADQTAAKRLVREAGLGLAPGVAFGAADEAGDGAGSWLRWCFASRDPQRLVVGVDRLKGWLARA